MTSSDLPTDGESSRTLLLLRHAKAETWSSAEGDHGRRLSGRGRRDAAEAGRWLVANGYQPDVVLCSSSTRTRETWAAVAGELAGAGEGVELVNEDRIYDAHVDDLLAVVREVEPTKRTVLLVGHAPGVPALAALLDRSGSSELESHFPTCAVAALTVHSSWDSLDEDGATLAAFATPRG